MTTRTMTSATLTDDLTDERREAKEEDIDFLRYLLREDTRSVGGRWEWVERTDEDEYEEAEEWSDVAALRRPLFLSLDWYDLSILGLILIGSICLILSMIGK